MPIYTELRPGATKRSTSNLSKHCDAFAKAALGEVFRARDLCLAREPDFQDRQPHEQPRRLGEVVDQVAAETGQKACLHWIDQASRAETPQQRTAALEIAQNIAKSLGLTLEDFLLGRAA